MIIRTSRINTSVQPRWPYRINWGSIQAQGLVSWLTWPDGYAILLPDSNVGSAVNGVWESRIDSVLGGGINFHGPTDRATYFAVNDNHFLTSSGITLVWWGNLDTLAIGQSLTYKTFASVTGNNVPFALYTDTLGSIKCSRGSATGTRTQGSNAGISAGTSYMVVVTYPDNLVETAGIIYVNGVEVASTQGGAGTGAVTGTAAALNSCVVGGSASGFSEADMFTSEVRLYNRFLPPSVIWSMYDLQTRYDLFYSPLKISYFLSPITVADPFVPVGWPIPSLGRRNDTGFIHTTTSLIPPPEAITNAQRNWPLPLVKKRPHVGHIDYDTFIDENVKPIGKDSFPININKKGRGVDWTQNRPQFYNDDKPFKQDAWPNPALEFKPAITHIHNRKPDEPPTPEPFKIPLFPNPLKKERVRSGHTDNFSLEETFTHPVGSSVQDLPVLNVKPLPYTWINPRPFYYTEPEVIVFRQTDWPNPQRKRRLNGVVNTHFLDTGTTQVPFNQTNWPLPLRKRIHPHWEDNYVLDDNVPFIYQVSFVPLSKSKFVPTWIRSLVLSDTDALPNIPYSYPNPIILKQHTQSWIENLLQRTLDPGEGEKPFNQNDYPNPLIGIRLLHVGWIDGRKHYFSEPPLQIGQYDWPVFRAPRINPVGFIHSQKQNEEPPKFVSVLEIPVLKKVLGISWIDTALINLSAPPTIQPFSQKDWPNPRFKIPYYNNFNIFRPTSLVPPNIVGRRICIDAGITIFELEAAIEEFDLNARMEEFNLEAGGEECE